MFYCNYIKGFFVILLEKYLSTHLYQIHYCEVLVLALLFKYIIIDFHNQFYFLKLFSAFDTYQLLLIR